MLRDNKINPIEVRKSVLKMLFNSGAGHLGSNMSVIETIMSMYYCINIEKIKNQDFDRSRIIISKGHCSAATCAVMAHFGIIDFKLLDTYHLDNSYLAGHVSHSVRGIEHSTGALGHGLSVGVGCAIGLKSLNITNEKVLVLCGDGEIQEGSIWESLMFAKHKKLNNLIVLIDNNQISSITDTHKVIDLRPLTSVFKGFGLNTKETDGHKIDEICSTIESCNNSDVPSVIICNTVKGKDVPFAENEPIWHYKTLNNELYDEALLALEKKE